MARNAEAGSQQTPPEGTGKKRGRIRTTLSQFRTAFGLTRKADRRLIPMLLAWGGGVFVVLLAIGFALGNPILFAILGVLFGGLTALAVFSRRAQRAMYLQVEGQFGAGVNVLKWYLTSRRGWEVTEAVRVNRQRDMVHRVIGKPGIILVGEGNGGRLKQLLAEERRYLTRLLGPEVKIRETDIVIGDGEGEVPIAKLERTFRKMRAVMRSGEVSTYSQRLRAVGERQVPIPKGPLPRGGRMPRGQVR
jgi:hypothetical protein